MATVIEILCVLAVFIILPETNGHNVIGTCAFGRDCNRCPNTSVEEVQNTFSSNPAPFEVCCASCKRNFFSFNVLWMTFCTCYDVKVTKPTKPKINSDTTNQGTTDFDVRGNCLYGNNCSSCGSKSITYSNGVAFCCPNCNTNSISVSSVNDIHTCSCPKQATDFDVRGNCLYGNNCSSCGSKSITYSNGVAFCCPNCNTNSISVSSVNNIHTCSCPKQATESDDISGDCLYRDSCNHCNYTSHRYGVAFCCPNCSDYPSSVTLVNNRRTCYCPRHTKKDFEISGNCLYGNNCSSCNSDSITYSNGVLFCCPNCNDNPISIASVNNRHTCICPQQKQKVVPAISSNCLYDSDCDGCNNVSIINNRRLCCPKCSGNMNSYTNNQGTTCTCS